MAAAEPGRDLRQAIEPVVALLLLVAACIEVAADAAPPLPMPVALLGALAIAVPVAVSYRSPEAAAAVVFAAIVLQGLAPRMPSSIAEQLALALAIAQATVRVRRAWPLLALGGAAAAAALVLREPDDVQVSDFLFSAGLLLAPFIVGLVLRARIRVAAADRARARLAEDRRDELAALAVREERARVARELHDVIAHALSVVVVQAAGGRAVLLRDPLAAEGAFTTIAETGARALEELRRLVGAMEGAEPSPSPGLDGLPDLVRLAGEAGAPAVLAVEGTPRPLLPSVELAAYRIVQEALTNTVRYAQGASTQVEVRHGDRLVIRVLNGAGTGDRPALPGTGNGVLGMRERASLCGGVLTAAPTADGGYLVEALLPAGAA